MNIAIDCRSVFPGRGGIGRYAQNLGRVLPTIDRKNNYFVFTTDRQTEKISNDAHQTAFQVGMLDSLWEQLQLPRMLVEYGIDLYHNPCFSLPIANEHSKLVATIHDVVFRECPEFVAPSLCEYLDRWTNVALKIADRIITVSNYSKQQIVKFYGTDSDKVDVVYNGIEGCFKQASKFEQERVLRKYNISHNFILYLGSVEPKKNINCLLDAQKIVCEMPSAPVLVIAGGKGGKDYDLKQAIQARRMENSVISLGYINEADVVALLSAAHIFVYPSLYEGFGFPPLEAMACETAVIVSDATCLPEIVADAAVIVSSKDPYKLALAIKRLLTDKEECRSFIDKGKTRVSNFTWEKCVEETLKVYHRVLM